MIDAIQALPGGPLMLLTKMAVTAGFVVLASLIAERTSPLIAAMVATLPVSAGPVYAFLALEHDAAFISAGALASTGANIGTTAFVCAYALVAQTQRTAMSLAVAFLAYVPVILLFRWLEWPALVILLVTLVLFPLAHLAMKRWMSALPAARVRPPWFAIPLRALAVSLMVATVTSISFSVGPLWSGLFAPFPIVMSSLIVILQPRMGGPATAAVLASGILGLMGFNIGLLAAHLGVLPLGKWTGLLLALLVCVAWNLVLTLHARRNRAKPA